MSKVPEFKSEKDIICNWLKKKHNYSTVNNIDESSKSIIRDDKDIIRDIHGKFSVRIVGYYLCPPPPELWELDIVNLQLKSFVLTDEIVDNIKDSLTYLSMCKIQVIPKCIIKLHKLQDLCCSCCNLRKIPCDIGMLTNLVNLDLSCSDFTHIPENISNLINLKHFDISANPISMIPDTICELKRLELLDISFCRITKLPENIGNLVNLNTLLCINEDFTGFPDSFRKLTDLRYLYVESYSVLPEYLSSFSNLKIKYNY